MATKLGQINNQVEVYDKSEVDIELGTKQDVLSEGAFEDGDKTKLDGIETGAEVNTINSDDADTIKVVEELPETPDENTLYFVEEE